MLQLKNTMNHYLTQRIVNKHIINRQLKPLAFLVDKVCMYKAKNQMQSFSYARWYAMWVPCHTIDDDMQWYHTLVLTMITYYIMLIMVTTHTQLLDIWIV